MNKPEFNINYLTSDCISTSTCDRSLPHYVTSGGEYAYSVFVEEYQLWSGFFPTSSNQQMIDEVVDGTDYEDAGKNRWNLTNMYVYKNGHYKKCNCKHITGGV